MSGSATPTSDTISPRSQRFRDSVHNIPTPGTEVHRPKRYEPIVLNIYIVGSIALLMICLGIALEIALHISDGSNGFSVPEKNVITFVSTQFLTSFVPTLLVVPLAYFWAVADWMLRWYQPYVTLSEGNAPAARSILLDYIALNRLTTLYHSLKHRHWLINISTLTALSAVFMQPLAGSLFQVRQVPYAAAATATSMRNVGLSPTINQLTSFLASAGYVDAAVYNNLQDPSFVHGGWSAAPFAAPAGSILNGTLAVNTTAIQTHVNCIKPTSFTTTTNLTNSNVVLSATFSPSCNATLSLDPNDGPDQFSVTAASTCAPSYQDQNFQPVLFWYYHLSDNGDALGTAVFCQPTIAIFVVATTMNLNDGSMGACIIVEPFENTNNVTGNPLNGEAFNGLMFDASNNTYLIARSLAINSGVPGAIYRFASQQPNGPQSVFDDPYGFVNTTKKIYTQYLSIAAQSIYFLPNNETIPAQLTSDLPRLFVESLPAHLLSILFICIGIASLVVHVLHKRSRRNLWLTSPPGSIATIVALTSRSGFGDLLLPYDDVSRMKSNLAGLTFRLDKRTGAIVAEEDFGVGNTSDNIALLGGKGDYDVKMGVNNFSPLSRTSFKDKAEFESS
ncbi:uncharacterized protein F5147DRAFT_681196 [Suillus discolor]|uniref:Uncharacterized protein n=1 Tax=Suillus discolor TaxID=1912936 RepID=A0A9P7FDF3_9AGAM|nr:uncharacterized protein F5147DRAFT_681196 [Suillus discolor]KAG2113491.1 hypothetical protein F5147DRAFT_681196 [Suillus discolor]